MKKEDLLKIEGMTDAIADEVLKAFSGYLPKSRFDEVNEAKKQAEKMIEDLKKSEGATDELKAKIEELQAENKKAFEALRQTKIDNAIENALKAAGARNVKTILPLLKDVNDIDENGVVKGLDKQIEDLIKSDGYLFNIKTNTDKPQLTGITPAAKTTQEGATVSKSDFNKMGYKERLELFNANRDLYDKLNN